MNIYIDGKDGFNSKSALMKFKELAKQPTFELDQANKYIKHDYKLSVEEKTDTCIRYKLTLDTTLKEGKKKMFQSKLKIMHDNRTNINIRNLSLNKDIVPSAISKAYRELMKISKIPVPEPLEILKKPEMHIPLIKDVLKNNMLSNLDSNHPYCKYFMLLAQHMNIQPDFQIPKDIQNIMNSSTPPDLVSVNDNNNANDNVNEDTETESD